MSALDLRLDRKRMAEAAAPTFRIERWAKPVRCTAEDFTL